MVTENNNTSNLVVKRKHPNRGNNSTGEYGRNDKHEGFDYVEMKSF